MKKTYRYSFLFLIFFLTLLPVLAFTQTSKQAVHIIPVKGIIDLGLSSFIERAAEQAARERAAAIIFEIDTFGGRVDAADAISAAIQQTAPVPTIAYVTNSAWSAGALIAISCKTIVMKPGSSIGSAEPRTVGMFSEQQTGDEKMISALRAKFKAVAEANNHPVNLAQAMVDKDIELVKTRLKNEDLILTREEFEAQKRAAGKTRDLEETILSPKGKLLNLTAQEAKNLTLAALIAAEEQEILKFLGIEQAAAVRHRPNWSENLARVFTHPVVSSLLLSLGILGLMFELRMPGWGISGTLGVIFLILFFWGHYLAGMANWVDIAVFTLGVILFLLEIFVIPGFGIFGILGIIGMLTGLFLAMIKHPFQAPAWEFARAFYIVSYAFVSAFVILLLSAKWLPHTSLWKRLRLESAETSESGFHTKSLPETVNIGKIGTSATILRPAGKALFDEEIVEVTTESEFIEKDKKIKVTRIDGNKIFVREIRTG